ncbi:MAG TPA: hypothetical protein V6C97_18115 [Oculatellaceae cyanobacterium]
MNTKAASILLSGAMLVATVVPAFASTAKTTAPAKSAKVCSVKKKSTSIKKAAVKAPVAAVKKTK